MEEKDRLRNDIKAFDALLSDIEQEMEDVGDASVDDLARLRELRQQCKLQLSLLGIDGIETSDSCNQDL